MVNFVVGFGSIVITLLALAALEPERFFFFFCLPRRCSPLYFWYRVALSCEKYLLALLRNFGNAKKTIATMAAATVIYRNIFPA